MPRVSYIIEVVDECWRRQVQRRLHAAVGAMNYHRWEGGNLSTSSMRVDRRVLSPPASTAVIYTNSRDHDGRDRFRTCRNSLLTTFSAAAGLNGYIHSGGRYSRVSFCTERFSIYELSRIYRAHTPATGYLVLDGPLEVNRSEKNIPVRNPAGTHFY